MMSETLRSDRWHFICQAAAQCLVPARGEAQQKQHASDAVGTASALADLLGFAEPETNPEPVKEDPAADPETSLSAASEASRELFTQQAAAALARAGALVA